ncbi:RHS repeat domain-containing protein [Paenibacillus sp. GCM10012307]|uniref:RHS repeat protein n=1 Tax=Paenibacillus roseus TaxID=2798579 RepID=A0A934MRS0_9BACL|nr:RHS repeat domain-containing protein [Paenibacillus roseus]MBJ6362604.1 RHS repeat protein [Paenibacillus roseus]
MKQRAKLKSMVIALIMIMLFAEVNGYAATEAKGSAAVQAGSQMQVETLTAIEPDMGDSPAFQSFMSEMSKKRAVERPELRRANEVHFKLPDGSYRAFVTTDPLFYWSEEGKYEEIGTALTTPAESKALQQRSAEFKNAINAPQNRTSAFKAVRMPFDVTIPIEFKEGYSIGKGGDYVRFIPQNVSESAKKGALDKNEKNKIRYRDVWSDTDVLLEVTKKGIKETITLKNEKAGKQFSFLIEGKNKEKFTIHSMFLVDKKGVKRAVSQQFRTDKGRNYLDIQVDTTGLTFPIDVDPSVTSPVLSGGDSFSFTIPQNVVVTNGKIGLTPKDNRVTRSRTYYSSLGDINFWSDKPSSLFTEPFRPFSLVLTATKWNGQVSCSNGSAPYTNMDYIVPSDPPATLMESKFKVVTIPPSPKPAPQNAECGVKANSDTYTLLRSTSNKLLPLNNNDSKLIMDVSGYIALTNSKIEFNNWNALFSNYLYEETEYRTVPSEYWNLGTNTVTFINSQGKATISVMYDYTLVGGARLISPIGGEVFGTSMPISWVLDPGPPTLETRFQVQYSSNDGFNWVDLVNETTSTQLTVNTAGYFPTTKGRVRVRANVIKNDGSLTYGVWNQSAAFSIRQPNDVYVYSNRNRLTDIYFANGYRVSYQYDANGNIVSKTRTLY